jgi:hypothetical protein
VAFKVTNTSKLGQANKEKEVLFVKDIFKTSNEQYYTCASNIGKVNYGI